MWQAAPLNQHVSAKTISLNARIGSSRWQHGVRKHQNPRERCGPMRRINPLSQILVTKDSNGYPDCQIIPHNDPRCMQSGKL